LACYCWVGSVVRHRKTKSLFSTHQKKKKKKRMKNVNKTELTIACLGDVNGDLVAINAVVERVMREHDLYVRVVF